MSLCSLAHQHISVTTVAVHYFDVANCPLHSEVQLLHFHAISYENMSVLVEIDDQMIIFI